MSSAELSDLLDQLIEAGRESPRLEYKGSWPWDEQKFKEILTRSILAMANMKDGGHIVIGVEQGQDAPNPAGVQAKHRATYNEEAIKDFVGNYADPYVDFSVDVVTSRDRQFVLITVREFAEIPVICKKDGRTDQGGLKLGSLYIRTRDRRPSSVAVQNQAQMRELLELAIDKGIRKLQQRGLVYGQRSPMDVELYDRETEDVR